MKLLIYVKQYSCSNDGRHTHKFHLWSYQTHHLEVLHHQSMLALPYWQAADMKSHRLQMSQGDQPSASM